MSSTTFDDAFSSVTVVDDNQLDTNCLNNGELPTISSSHSQLQPKSSTISMDGGAEKQHKRPIYLPLPPLSPSAGDDVGPSMSRRSSALSRKTSSVHSPAQAQAPTSQNRLEVPAEQHNKNELSIGTAPTRKDTLSSPIFRVSFCKTTFIYSVKNILVNLNLRRLSYLLNLLFFNFL